MQELKNNLNLLFENINKATSIEELNQLKSNLLGKTGIITSILKKMSEIPTNKKKEFGEEINRIKKSIEESISNKKKNLEENATFEKLKNNALDVTLPISNNKFGGLHLITQSVRRIRDYYSASGFSILDGPEIESDFFNFDALNMPKHHPARQSQDTFYIENTENSLLRTHTSCAQVRAMLEKGANVRMISIGRTYRSDALDATHSPMFHQVECLVVDKNPISIGNLKSELKKFVSFFLESFDVEIRFRPSFFPFTEPSMEVDCKYYIKDGETVISKSGDKWMELGGAGMVHPNVFKFCNIEQPAYGFAFGFGLERLTMLKNGISDIRNLFNADDRWLKYYSK